jgi:S1-C subfamily serine protease
LQFGTFSDVAEGDDVIYVGHPFGVIQEVTSKGMVSWMGKSEFGNAFQLNAIVNSGNSGGPLIDIKSGHVVGIVKAKYGELSPYLKGLKNGTVEMGMQFTGGGFDLQRFVKDVTNMMDLHIQMGIGYAVSTEYVEAELNKVRSKQKAH